METTGYMQVHDNLSGGTPYTYTVYPKVPPHDCPARRVRCPDCGQDLAPWPRYPAGPVWVVDPRPSIVWSNTATS